MSRSYKKPWVKDHNPDMKKIHSRRYRRYIRQDVKQWRNKYDLGFPGCAYCDCLDEYWDNDQDVLFWQHCLSFELEPEYPPRHRWIDKINICDWRIHYEDVAYLHK